MFAEKVGILLEMNKRKEQYLLNMIAEDMKNDVHLVLNDSKEDPQYSAVITYNVIRCYIDVMEDHGELLPYHTVSEYIRYLYGDDTTYEQFKELKNKESAYFIGWQYEKEPDISIVEKERYMLHSLSYEIDLSMYGILEKADSALNISAVEMAYLLECYAEVMTALERPPFDPTVKGYFYSPYYRKYQYREYRKFKKLLLQELETVEKRLS